MCAQANYLVGTSYYLVGTCWPIIFCAQGSNFYLVLTSYYLLGTSYCFVGTRLLTYKIKTISFRNVKDPILDITLCESACKDMLLSNLGELDRLIFHLCSHFWGVAQLCTVLDWIFLTLAQSMIEQILAS